MFVLDQDEAVDFYVGQLGLEVSNDQDLGFMRWLTVRVPGQPDRDILLERPGPPAMDEETAGQVRELITKGASGFTVGFTTPDCKTTYETLVAQGVEITQEPVEQAYGTDIGIRDPFGNHSRIVQLPSQQETDRAGTGDFILRVRRLAATGPSLATNRWPAAGFSPDWQAPTFSLATNRWPAAGFSRDRPHGQHAFVLTVPGACSEGKDEIPRYWTELSAPRRRDRGHVLWRDRGPGGGRPLRAQSNSLRAQSVWTSDSYWTSANRGESSPGDEQSKATVVWRCPASLV